MIVLGIDTATPSSAVGLRLADGRTLDARDDPALGAHPGHATRTLALAGELLAQAHIGWRDLDRIAVGVGPGTFTGLRVGLASARGLAQSLEVELVGVSSLRALAAGADPDSTDPAPAVLAVLDARRGEVFAAAYARAAEPGAAPSELAGPRALAPADLDAIVQAAAGARDREVLAVGDGAERYRDQLQALGAAVPPSGSPVHRIDGGAICALGASAPAEPLEAVLPDYCRRPDAELALAAAGGGA